MTRFSAGQLTDPFVPYYFQIASLLRRQIEQGELAAGARLPGEAELAGTFGVSKMPVRQALSLLAAEGLLNRKRGRGTFVARNFRTPKMFKLTGIIEDFAVQSAEGVLRLLSAENVPATAQLAGFFRVPEGEAIARFRRLRMVGDVPICYVSNYLRTEAAKRIRKADLRTLGMLRIIEKRLGAPIRHVHQTVEARTADSEVAEHLSLEVTAPVLYAETFIYGESGEPVEFSRNFFPGGRYKYSVDLVSDGQGPGAPRPRRPIPARVPIRPPEARKPGAA